MQKELSEHQQRVKSLESDLQSMKTQKVQMQKRIREEQERLKTLKVAQQRELSRLKQ